MKKKLVLYIEDCYSTSYDCRDSAELFATSSKDDVRVWHAQSGKELLRITMANLMCHAVVITPDGKAIVTGTYRCVCHT